MQIYSFTYLYDFFPPGIGVENANATRRRRKTEETIYEGNKTKMWNGSSKWMQLLRNGLFQFFHFHFFSHLSAFAHFFNNTHFFHYYTRSEITCHSWGGWLTILIPDAIIMNDLLMKDHWFVYFIFTIKNLLFIFLCSQRTGFQWLSVAKCWTCFAFIILRHRDCSIFPPKFFLYRCRISGSKRRKFYGTTTKLV